MVFPRGSQRHQNNPLEPLLGIISLLGQLSCWYIINMKPIYFVPDLQSSVYNLKCMSAFILTLMSWQHFSRCPMTLNCEEFSYCIKCMFKRVGFDKSEFSGHLMCSSLSLPDHHHQVLPQCAEISSSPPLAFLAATVSSETSPQDDFFTRTIYCLLFVFHWQEWPVNFKIVISYQVFSSPNNSHQDETSSPNTGH